MEIRVVKRMSPKLGKTMGYYITALSLVFL
jgi:hypothetical protein